jgi:phospholipid/cholesterol/gamma-HCH transport system permease protein
MPPTKPSIEVFSHKVVCSGSWTLTWADELLHEINQLATPSVATLQIDASRIETIDTAGAWLLNRLVAHFHAHQVATEISQLKKNQENLFNLVHAQASNLPDSLTPPKRLSPIESLGKEATDRTMLFIGYLSFIGELAVLTIKDLFHPVKISWRAIASTIEEGGCYALPIIALLNFLVGIVLAYQMGLQLKNYGANIYIVDLLGLSVLREFAPLITAIIVAGRTGSAFTAEIGTMVVNEEVDALKTMGINPTNFLGLPKLFGMILALPLLTVWAIIFGVFGGMVMASNMLSISFATFLERFHDAIAVSHYAVGLIKTPIFAMIIASVGCFQGFQVARRADSVGKQTTKSVVQATFLIIIVDALFSILFSWAKI